MAHKSTYNILFDGAFARSDLSKLFFAGGQKTIFE
jgi:hypothetical protein